MKNFSLTHLYLWFFDTLFRPFYTLLHFFPFNIKMGRFPFYRQCTFLHFRLTRSFRNTPLKRHITFKKNAEFNLLLTPGTDFHQMHLFMAGVYEKALSAHILSDCENTDIFIDAGAYLGYYALLAATLRPDLEVIAFEPRHEAIIQLKKNIQENTTENITLIPLALGQKAGTATLHTLRFPEQASLLHAETDAHCAEVKVTPVDEAISCTSKNVLVKIDTEGYEFEVLNGMMKTLRENNCKVYFEFNPQLYTKFFGSGYIDHALAQIESLGYRLFVLNKKGTVTAFIYVPGSTAQQTLLITKNSGF